jgi:hypothetical protein
MIYESSNQKKVRIMTDSKSKVAIFTGAPKRVGAANSKELADGDACWMTHWAVAVMGEGR